MKIKVYNNKEQGILRLALKQGVTCVDLVVVDETGERVDGGLILSVTPDGIVLYRRSKCGLPTDAEGRVVIV